MFIFHFYRIELTYYLKKLTHRLFLLALVVFLPLLCASQSEGKGTLKGLITEKESGDPLIGANIYLKNDITIGTTTDIDGKYSMELAPGEYSISFSYTGMKLETRLVLIEAGETIVLNLNLLPFSYDFDEITISAGRYERSPEQLMVTTEMVGKAVIEAKNTITIATVL